MAFLFFIMIFLYAAKLEKGVDIHYTQCKKIIYSEMPSKVWIKTFEGISTLFYL